MREKLKHIDKIKKGCGTISNQTLHDTDSILMIEITQLCHIWIASYPHQVRLHNSCVAISIWCDKGSVPTRKWCWLFLSPKKSKTFSKTWLQQGRSSFLIICIGEVSLIFRSSHSICEGGAKCSFPKLEKKNAPFFWRLRKCMPSTPGNLRRRFTYAQNLMPPKQCAQTEFPGMGWSLWSTSAYYGIDFVTVSMLLRVVITAEAVHWPWKGNQSLPSPNERKSHNVIWGPRHSFQSPNIKMVHNSISSQVDGTKIPERPGKNLQHNMSQATSFPLTIVYSWLKG